MTDIEKQALALVNEVRAERGLSPHSDEWLDRNSYRDEALCRAVKMLNAEREAHAATKREVSDAVEERFNHNAPVYGCLSRFIIKPPVDPVRLILESVCFNVEDRDVERAKATLAARGGRIVFDGGE